MADIYFSFSQIPTFAKALKEAAPEHLRRAMGKAFSRIGKSDIEKMKTSLSGLNIRSKRFRNSFKFKATDSREAKSINDLQLSEYTGAKPFRIFQTGGTITPTKSKMLMILTDAARNKGGTRKYSQKELSAMIASGQAKIIQTKAGPAVIQVEKLTKGGNYRKGAKAVILAWLKPQVQEKKRIDFFANFESNSAAHDEILAAAAEEAIRRTIAEDDSEDQGDD